MKLLHCFIIFYTCSLSMVVLAQNSRPIGTNLTGISDYSSEFIFVDAFKQSREWIAHDIGPGAPWSSSVTVPLGTNGYPLEIPYNNGTNPPQGLRSLLFFGDLNGIYPGGNYRLIVTGTGVLNLEAGAAGTFNCPVDTIVTVNNSSGGVIIDIVESSSSDPISEINFVMPGFHTSFVNEPFHPKFLDFLDDFQVLRFMDWLATNNSENENWLDRNSPNNYTQTLENGVAPEIIIDLCNREMKNPWICIPHAANDDYIVQMATLLRNTLDTNLTIHVEYSNEVWNTIFSQNQYSIDEGTVLGYSGTPWEVSRKYYAKRSANVFHLFDSVFVGTDRLNKVLASHAADDWLSNDILTIFSDPFYNSNQTTANALAVAPYFGAVADELGNAGLAGTCTVSQILDSMEATLPEAYVWMQATKIVADNHNVDLIAYEGGQHLVAGSAFHNDIAFVDKLIEANRDPRMTELYCQYFNYWYDSVTPSLFCNFSSLYVPNKYGSWGVKEHFDDTLAPKYVGLINCVFPYNSSMSNLEEASLLEKDLLLFPNPTNSTITVSFSNEIVNDIELSIYNSVGKKVQTENLKTNESINIQDLTYGIYYFEFIIQNGSDTNIIRKNVIKI